VRGGRHQDPPRSQTRSLPAAQSPIVIIVNFAECPDDGSRLKAVPTRPDPRRPLVMTCPHCGKRFTLTGDGVREIPPDGSAT